MIHRLALTALLLLLAGCGFSPLYGGAGGTALQANLAGISVSPIPERSGQILRQSLLDRMGQSDPQYRLDIKLEQTDAGSGFRADEATTRINITLLARYELHRISDGKLILSDETSAFSAYDVVESEYATLTARQDTLHDLAELLSQRITARLVAHFRAAGDDSHETAAAGH